MRKMSLVCSLLLTTLLSFGQSDHLIPARDFNSTDSQSKSYYDKVFPLLNTGFSHNPYARYTVMPSFNSEYALSVEKIGDQYFILSNKLSEDYWSAKSRMAVKLVMCKMEIDEELFLKIGELFSLLADQTKVPVPRKVLSEIDGEMVELEIRTVIMDGIVYYFALTDENGEIKIGETHSPGENSLVGRVIQLCDNLHSMKTENSLSQINILINELKNRFEFYIQSCCNGNVCIVFNYSL